MIFGHDYKNKEWQEGGANHETPNLIHSKLIQGYLWF